MASLGITTETEAGDNLIAGANYVAIPLPLDSTVGTAAKGQVLAWDGTGHNWIKYASGYAAHAYAILLEAVALSADGAALCLVKGEVNLRSLDATAQADDDIVAALLSSGIIPRSAVQVEV